MLDEWSEAFVGGGLLPAARRQRSATAAATPAAADDGESAEELRRKVARLKRLLRAAGVALASKAAESG